MFFSSSASCTATSTTGITTVGLSGIPRTGAGTVTPTPPGGVVKPPASDTTNPAATGASTPATATTAPTSSSTAPGSRSAAVFDPTMLLPASKPTGRTASGSAMADRGGNGAQPARVDFDSPELLTSVLIDDQWHACYPTGLLTLCGLKKPQTVKGRRYPPDCGECSLVARRFHRIDKSMPEHWLPEVVA